ncbi:MAG: hypothetical protein B0D92_00940 [Spirochaeta sp. LUC14_002_19_P3]|nr:MAG: hypothetical protein B0D92_00940 [Spirochaeta sp. LUC14_002_19_P3]
MEKCPCGSGAGYADCCEIYISGKALVPTAEKLLRSRYSAYVKGCIDYIMSTHHPDTLDTISREATEKWSKKSQWMGLEIHSAEEGGTGDSRGMVEFTAIYRNPGRELISHREKSFFERMDNRWYFKDYQMINDPQTRDAPKVGRNDSCPCGSGKKYKKCCGV